MARHNREVNGSDQRGFEYTVSYQPDWLHQVKVTRILETGRQSTKTLLTNPDPPIRKPGQQVRTAIQCEAQGLSFEIAVTDPGRVVRRIVVETESPDGDVQFTIDGRS
jgi:hypothetical protein